MSNRRPTVGIWQDAIIWHVDWEGVFHWGSPKARMAALARERARREDARDRKAFREMRRPVGNSATANPRLDRY